MLDQQAVLIDTPWQLTRIRNLATGPPVQGPSKIGFSQLDSTSHICKVWHDGLKPYASQNASGLRHLSLLEFYLVN
jgi:hypothetical protein